MVEAPLAPPNPLIRERAAVEAPLAPPNPLLSLPEGMCDFGLQTILQRVTADAFPFSFENGLYFPGQHRNLRLLDTQWTDFDGWQRFAVIRTSTI